MSQPSPKAPAGLQYDQTTTHPHRLSPVSYGVAHTKTGCTLHPSDAQAIRPPTLWSSAPAASETGEGGRPVQQLVAQESDSFNKGSKWIGGFFDRAQPSFTAQPELSRAFTRWQEYISHHIEALSHSPPQFTVQLTSTLHDVEEKCDMSGVCLAIILPLRVMGMDEQHCMAYGMLPRHDVVVCVEVGRQLSSSQTAIAFHYSVQVFSVADAVGSSALHVEDRSSFPLACLLRQKVAALLEGYPPFFPGPNHPPHPLNSFPSCIQSLVTAHVSASTGERRSLLSVIGGWLPENPIVHIMREIQSALRESNRVCVVCGDQLPIPTALSSHRWCQVHSKTCDEAFLSSPFTVRTVHPFIQSRPQQVDLFLHVLAAAASAIDLYPVPVAVTWAKRERDAWDRQCFRNRAQVIEAIQLMPAMDELLLYDESELAKQLNDVHACLLPLLAWTISTYSTFLFALAPLSMPVVPARNIHHMAVSLRPTMTMTETDAYLIKFDGLLRHRKRTWMLDNGQPPDSFISAGLWLLHVVLVHHGIISVGLLDELHYISRRLRAPLAYHRYFLDAAEAARAILNDQRRGRQQPVSQCDNSAHPACACVLMVEEMTDKQAQAEMQSADRRSTPALLPQYAQICWVVRAVYTIAAVQHEEEAGKEEEAEQERKWGAGRHATSTERCYVESDRPNKPWYERDAEQQQRREDREEQKWRHQPTQYSLYNTDHSDEERDNKDEEQEDEEEDEGGEDDEAEQDEDGQEEWRSETQKQTEMHSLDVQPWWNDSTGTPRLDDGSLGCTLSNYSIDQQLSLDAADDEKQSKSLSVLEID